MFTRGSLRVVGSARPCTRLVARQCRHQRPVRFYSDAKDERSNPVDRIASTQSAEWQEPPRTINGDDTKISRPVGERVEVPELDNDGETAKPLTRRQRAEATAQQLRDLRAGSKQSQPPVESAIEAANEDTTGHEFDARDLVENMSQEEQTQDFENTPTLQQQLNELEQFDKQDITPVTFTPAPVTRAELLHSGQGNATITAGNFEGVIQDRVKALTERSLDTTRYAPEMAKTMMRGGLISFNSSEERDAVVGAAKDYAHRLKRSASNVRKGLPDIVSEFGFAPLPDKIQNSIVDRYVRGRHTDLAGRPHRKPELNHVRNNLARNGTYLGRDGAVFMKKFEGLMAIADRKDGKKVKAKK